MNTIEEQKRSRKTQHSSFDTLPTIDTSVPPTSNRSSAVSATPESGRSYSATRTRRGLTPLNLELPILRTKIRREKALPPSPGPSHPPGFPKSPREYLHQFLSSPRFTSQPPLSARSTAFLITLQRSFISAVDSYLHRRFSHPSTSPPYQPTGLHCRKWDADLEAQASRWGIPLTLTQKVTIGICSTLMLLIPAFVAVYIKIAAASSPRQLQHIFMGSTMAVVILAILIMIIVKRRVGEILIMVGVAVLICNCVTDHAFVSNG